MSTDERPESLDPLRHERGMHQVEHELQNEELRQAQVELEATRDRCRNFCDFAPVGYLTLSTEGLICEADLTAAALLGEDRQRRRVRGDVGPGIERPPTRPARRPRSPPNQSWRRSAARTGWPMARATAASASA